MAATDLAPNADTVTLTEPATYNGVRAGNTGDRVPRALADRHEWAYRENDEPDPADVAPAGNASLEDWQAFALRQDGVTEADIEGLGRDDLRAKFGS